MPPRRPRRPEPRCTSIRSTSWTRDGWPSSWIRPAPRSASGRRGESIGATLVNDPGSLTWNELSSTDVPKAIEFYETLFGWNVEEIDTGDFPPYWSIGHDGGAGGRNGGMRELPQEHQDEGVPSNWMPYFTVRELSG